ncbi:MAG: GNAT family N-acetyltransferase [Alphaproteobacteria bacterium]|nr:GNAT family N-acetyltransferase [Alphaproteobacteria bacterium]
MSITIAPETPLQDEVRSLIAALNARLLLVTPPEHCHHMSVEEMARPDTTVFIAREADVAIACGALRRHQAGIAEVKRMYTVPAAQGRGVGGRILEAITRLAEQERFRRLVLETGTEGFEAAWRVYERAGFRRCGPVLDYPPSPFTAFYEKALGPLP